MTQHKKKIEIHDASDDAERNDSSAVDTGGSVNPADGEEPDIDLDDAADDQAADMHTEADANDEAQPEPGEGDTLDSLRAERDQLKEKWLRALADYQNYIRRAEQNVITTREQTTMSIARSLVTVLDHFDHALSVDPEKTSTQSVLDGVQIVRDELLRALEGFGVRKLDAKPGEEFDPNRHEALMRQPTDEFEADRVVSQMQPGYAIGEKTLRPAKVSIAAPLPVEEGEG